MTTREKILNAACVLFAERGYDGVSVRDIVRAAGVNLGAITYHFGGKEQLFGEVTVLRGEPLREIALSVAQASGDAEQKLRKLCQAFAMHVLREDPTLRVMFLELLSGGRRLPPAAVERMTWRNELVAGIIEQGIHEGVFRDCDVPSAVWSLNGVFLPYVFFPGLAAKLGKDGRYSKATVEKIVENAMDLFLSGIRAERKQRKR